MSGIALTRVGASIGRGALVFFGVPIDGLALLVTVVAIPLGIGVLLALVPLFALGYVASAYWLGRMIIGAPGPVHWPPWWALPCYKRLR